MNNGYDFGLILQDLRKAKGMTQEQLARKIDKESSVISKYEKNQQCPTFDTVRSFARIFNVSMDYLSGMEKTTSISTVGLTPEQSQLLRNIADIFRTKNNAYNKKMSSEQYELLGQIVAEFSK